MQTMLRKFYFVFLFALCALFYPSAAYGETDSINSDRYSLYYFCDRTDLQEDYLDNALQMMRIRDILARSPRIDSIAIYAYASPEGAPRRNEWLARRRAEVAREFILANLPNDSVLLPENIILHPMGENWEGLYEELDANYHLMNRDRVMRIMRANVPTETKKWRLKRLDNGYTYSWIIKHHMPALRVATWLCVYIPIPEFEQDTMPEIDTVAIVMPEPELMPMPVDTVSYHTRMFPFALKTNLLYDAVTALNAELEIPIGKRWSIAVEDVFPWWETGNKYCFQIWEMGVEGRYWPYRTDDRKHLTGLFGGVYLMSGMYDLQNDRKFNYQGEFWSTGVSVGYAFRICRLFNLEFSASLGYLSTHYQHYMPTDDYDMLIRDKYKFGRYGYFGPTKLKVSLVMPIELKFKRKGGGR